MGAVEADLLYPREMPDLFRGTQVTLIGRYRNSSDVPFTNLRLTGRTGSQVRTFDYPNLRFPLENSANDFLPRLWATRRVGWLMEQVRTNGEQKELVDEITDLGTRYGIVTPYTSYLALEAAEAAVTVTSNRAVQSLRMTAPGSANKSVARRGAVGGAGAPVVSAPDMSANEPPPAPKRDAAQAVTGEAAVRESRRARAQQEAVRVDDDELALRVLSSRKVGDKTFYLRDGVWVDSEFKAEAKLPETALAFGSEEYFALVSREPELARFFALGERVVVVHKGHVYRVNAGATK
jgi:Ca-activated chloride channel family protein